MGRKCTKMLRTKWGESRPNLRSSIHSEILLQYIVKNMRMFFAYFLLRVVPCITGIKRLWFVTSLVGMLSHACYMATS